MHLRGHDWHPSAMIVADARAAYFARNGFSAAAYDARWVRIRLFGIPLVFPNVRSRRRAIRFHDLHHVLTGYGADPRGESEIGAWEIAATFPDRGLEFAAAWLLNTAMFVIGLAIAPRRVYRAFVRGRHSGSLYRRGWSEELLAVEVGVLQRELELDAVHAATWRDQLVFTGFVAALGAMLAVPASLLFWLAA